MAEEKVVNKIVPVETIIEIANYLEDQTEEYKRLFEMDEQKNRGLKFSEQIHEYKGDYPKIKYTVEYKNGKELTETNYNWFIGALDNLEAIKRISMYCDISYSSNVRDRNNYEYKKIHIWLHFTEDTVSISVDGRYEEEQTNRIHSYIRGLIEKNDDRYNKTVRNRKIRIQSFCFSIGFILSYIIYFILMANKDKIPVQLSNYLDSKMVIIIGQWFVSAIVGNVLGLPIMLALYRNILPKTKYSHYSKSSHKSVYVDNIDDYISHNEVQIGDFANNGKNRIIIEKIYKITSKIVLIQLAISILLFFILK